MPGALGFYHGLTGARSQGADAVHAGFATHYVSRARLPELSAALARDGVAVLAEFAKKLPQFSLAGERETIDRCFGAGSVKEIVRRLERGRNGMGWSGACGVARHVAFRAVLVPRESPARCGPHSCGNALQGEIRLTRTLSYHHEFLEGVRAMVLDKDRQPKWDPARIEDVDEAAVPVLFGE